MEEDEYFDDEAFSQTEPMGFPSEGAYIRIVSVSPSSAAEGVQTTFQVTVEYSTPDGQYCMINVGANTDSDPDIALIYAQQDVDAEGSATLSFSCTPIRRADSIIVIYADMTLPGSDEPLASDAYAIQLSGSPDSSNVQGFSIIGTWKSVGEEGVGQAQPGAIIVFADYECNLFSPRDTYALYKDGDTLRLDATGLLGGTLECSVIVVDNDHIELYSGSIITYLQRVG